MRAEVAYLKELKALSQKADRKGQSQTVQTLRAQHPLKYLLHIANLPKAASTTITKTDLTPTKPTKPSLSKPTGGIKDATGKGALPQHWVGTAKSGAVDEAVELKAPHTGEKSLPPSRHGRDIGTPPQTPVQSPKAQRKMADRRYRTQRGRTANCTSRQSWTRSTGKSSPTP